VIQRVEVRRRAKACGDGLTIGNRVVFTGIENMEFGRNVAFSDDSRVIADGPNARMVIGDNFGANYKLFMCAGPGETIEIGRDVLVGPNVVMRAGNHAFDSPDLPIKQQGHRHGSIRIGDDVWIGANVVITPDVTIGDHAVVGAGAVVVKDVEPWDVVGGVPARKIKSRPHAGA
jgi:galactoside O-acetyltransferase